TASKILAIALMLLFAASIHADGPASSHLESVERFIAAFNAHDSAAMANLVTDDVAWSSISHDGIEVQARGKRELVASMDAYFSSCATCRSEISEAISTRDRVGAIEVASWQGKDGARSQRSLSVYEFSGGLIHRVYYFPAEK